MILRRVIAHFRKQEWTAIAIDFMIVVIGVFVGIQVSNWNEARAVRASAEDFHIRLMDDLRLEAINYRLLADYCRDVRMAAENVHAGLVGKIELSDADLLVNAFRASQYTWAERHRATFDELVASGSLDLIYDPELRTQITGYYEMSLLDEISRDSQNSEYRLAFRKSVSPEIHQALHEQCGDRQVEGAPLGIVTLNYACEFKWPQEEIAAAADIIRSDQSMPPLLRLQIANLNSRGFSLQQNWDAYGLDRFYREDGAK